MTRSWVAEELRESKQIFDDQKRTLRKRDKELRSHCSRGHRNLYVRAHRL
jgi:hypothetical protein